MGSRMKMERWKVLLLSLLALAAVGLPEAQAQEKKPNILVIFGDGIGQSNISAYTIGDLSVHTGYT